MIILLNQGQASDNRKTDGDITLMTRDDHTATLHFFDCSTVHSVLVSSLQQVQIETAADDKACSIDRDLGKERQSENMNEYILFRIFILVVIVHSEFSLAEVVLEMQLQIHIINRGKLLLLFLVLSVYQIQVVIFIIKDRVQLFGCGNCVGNGAKAEIFLVMVLASAMCIRRG